MKKEESVFDELESMQNPLVEYLKIGPTEDLNALALEYAVNEQFTLLGMVVIELKKRANEDKAMTGLLLESVHANVGKGVEGVPEGTEKETPEGGRRKVRGSRSG